MLLPAGLHEEMRRQAQASWVWKTELMSPEAQERFFDDVGVKLEARERLRRGEALRAEDLVEPPPPPSHGLFSLLRLPDAVALSVWTGVPAQRWQADWEQALVVLVARHAERSAPALEAYARRRPVQSLRAGRCIDSPGLATAALEARRRLKMARPVATEWLLLHPDTAAQVLLHQLFGIDEPRREDARTALHDPALHPLHPALRHAAAALGPAAADALRVQLEADPLLHLPVHMPRLPTFFDPSALHRPRLHADGSALPDEAVRHLGLMLAISRRGQPYAGLEVVRAVCQAESLAEFVWTLFEAWWAASAPSKEAWCFDALGLLGDDGTAHRLGARTMRMAQEGAKNRAQFAVDLLAEFGSDPALMHLNDLAERCRVSVVRQRAAAHIEAVAQERSLSRLELADRLVPTLGLDQSRTLYFGPRRFEVGFDETLTPFVRDAQGARLKDLPKPRQTDDTARAEAASLRWKQLKQEMKTLARVQVARLERAMIDRRRWSADEVGRFFVTHPLMRELAARVVWGVFDAQGRVLDALRVAEDGSFANADDQRDQPPVGAQMGIAHPLELSPNDVKAFQQQFADYELLQPFAQLTREVYPLGSLEAAASTLNRFDGHDVATGALVGLLDKGWRRGATQDGGAVLWIERPIGPGLVARLWLTPGMFVGRLTGEPRQTLGKLDAVDTRDPSQPYGLGQPSRFEEAEAIALSETLRDLHRLSPHSPQLP